MLRTQQPELELLAENLAYLEKREPQMQYPYFQEQGWPIGSGMVESGNKKVVEARLKGAGMHWQRKNVDPMLGLRNIVCSDRWPQEWVLIARLSRQQAQQDRCSKREKRRLANLPEKMEVQEIPQQTEIERLVEEMPPSPIEKPKGTGSKKPAANHPWRHAPIGRSRYEPSKNATK